MLFLWRLYKALRGLVLYLQNRRRFDAAIFTDKRLAIVGPAASAYKTGRGAFIDGFDYVVRINKAAFLIKEGKFKQDIGCRVDILFHSFFENEFSGGGPLDFQLYDTLQIKYVINPIPTIFGKRATFNFYKKYLCDRMVYEPDARDYNVVISAFGNFRPTTGFCALMMLLNSNFSELFITGFTFFKTAYGDGYRDALKDVEKNKKYIADSKIHDPDLEYENFKVLFKKNAHKRIFVDNDLRLILAQDGIEANEIELCNERDGNI